MALSDGVSIVAAPDSDEVPVKRGSFFRGLRGRLLLLTAAMVLLGLILISPPLASSYRNGWLEERMQAAQISLLAVEAAPDGRVSDELSRQLLDQAHVVAVAVEGEELRELILAPSVPIDGPIERVEMAEIGGFNSIPATLGHLFAPAGRFLQVVQRRPDGVAEDIEVIVPESALRGDLILFLRYLFVVSLILLGVAGVAVYFAIYVLVVRPMRGLTREIVRIERAPETVTLGESPGTAVEIDQAHDALKTMQETVATSIRHRKRLADLGEAMAKINHDLRNSLSTAQIVSDSMAQSEDPRVRRGAPRLERSIQRAIGLAEATLNYGKSEPPGAQVQKMELAPVVKEAADDALVSWSSVSATVDVAADILVEADPDHVHRIIANLSRNAALAIVGQGEDHSGEVRVTAQVVDGEVLVDVADTGPGIPPRVQPRLFQAFEAGSRDGAGLGLAISRELAHGMKGELTLERSSDDGAMFRLRLPGA